MSNLIMCEYGNCEVSLPEEEMTQVGDDDNPVYVCPGCEDKVFDRTGYCSLSCQLGRGCDESC